MNDDGGHAQPQHDRYLGGVDAQLEPLAGEERRGQREQSGQGEEDLPGDDGGMEQAPGAACVGGLDQAPRAVPAQVQPGQADRQAVRACCCRRVAGQEPALAQLLQEQGGIRAVPPAAIGRQPVTDGRFGAAQFHRLVGAVVDQHPVDPPAAALFLACLHPRA